MEERRPMNFGIKVSYEGRIIAKKKANSIEELEPVMKELKKKFKK